MRLVVLNKAGEPGKIAVNPDRVTHLRAGPGNFVRSCGEAYDNMLQEMDASGRHESKRRLPQGWVRAKPPE